MLSRNNIITAAAVVFSVSALFAFDTGMGARAAGMGNVFTAAANDGYATYYNPAGPAMIKTLCVGSTYGSYFTGLTDGTSVYEADIAVVIPDNKSGFGLYWQENGLKEIYSEDTLAGGYAVKLDDRLAVGATVKLRSVAYANNDSTYFNKVFSTLSVSAISADAGAIYSLSPGFQVGAAVADILQPNLGIADKSVIPMTIRGGAAWYPLSGGKSRNLLIAAEGALSGNNWTASAGSEFWIAPKLACIRAGYTMGNDNLNVVAGGAGLRLGQVMPGMALQLDYSFEMSLGYSELGGNHRFSLNVYFDAPAQPVVSAQAAQPEQPAVSAPPPPKKLKK